MLIRLLHCLVLPTLDPFPGKLRAWGEGQRGKPSELSGGPGLGAPSL